MQDIATKVEGSQLTPEEFNQIPSELENVITSTGQTLTSTDLRQLVKAIAIYAAKGEFYTPTGTANNIVLYPIDNMESPSSYSLGLKVRFIPTLNNTGVVTISIKNLTTVSLLDNEGNNLSANYLITNQIYTATFDGTNFKLSEIPIALVRQLISEKAGLNDNNTFTGTNNFVTPALSDDSRKPVTTEWIKDYIVEVQTLPDNPNPNVWYAVTGSSS